MQEQLLKRLGYDVQSYTSSPLALEAFQDAPEEVDLVITDMAMPYLPGDLLVKEMLNIRSDIPILICTGFSEIMSEDKARELGAAGLLMKPIIINVIAEKLRSILDTRV